MHVDSDLSKMLRKARGDLNLSFVKLAKKSGIALGTLQSIETRPNYGARAQTLEKIAIILKLDINEVLNVANLLNHEDSPINILIGGVPYTKIFILGSDDKKSFAPMKTSHIENGNLNPETLKSYKIKTAEMEPVFQNGGTLFLETAIGQGFGNIENSDVYLFDYKEHTYLRQLFIERSTVYVESGNKKFRDFELTSDEFKDVTLIGMVLSDFYYQDWL